MIKLTDENLQEFNSLTKATKSKFVLMFNDKKYFFKTCYNISSGAQAHSLINEVLVSHMARKSGMNCTEVHFAQVNFDGKTYIGVLTPNFLENNFAQFSLQKFTIPYFEHMRDEAGIVGDMDGERFWSKKIKNYAYYNNVEESLKSISYFLNSNNYDKSRYRQNDVKKVKTDLTNIAVMDFFVNNQDRHCENIEIMVPDKQSNEFLKVAPIFDNELCFFPDGSFDDVVFRISSESFQKSEKQYANELISYIKKENLKECSESLNYLQSLNLEKEIIECLSNEFECGKSFEEISNAANENGLKLSANALSNRSIIYNAKKEIFESRENDFSI